MVKWGWSIIKLFKVQDFLWGLNSRPLVWVSPLHSGDPHSMDPRSGDPWSVDPWSWDPQTRDLRTGDPSLDSIRLPSYQCLIALKLLRHPFLVTQKLESPPPPPLTTDSKTRPRRCSGRVKSTFFNGLKDFCLYRSFSLSL